jgi:cytidylate kinase
MIRPRIIAIDGPVASGKSAVGRALARHLGYAFLDTGLMYRAVTLAAVRRGLAVDDTSALATLAEDLDITAKATSDGTRIFLDGDDITDQLRLPEVEQAVSRVSRVAEVREKMVEQQRAIAAQQPVVMADADLKVYLDAGVEERARRRHAEIAAAGQQATLGEIEAGLRQRDSIDSGRTISPLRPAEDAHIINTDGLSIEQVVTEIERLIDK